MASAQLLKARKRLGEVGTFKNKTRHLKNIVSIMYNEGYHPLEIIDYCKTGLERGITLCPEEYRKALEVADSYLCDIETETHTS